jgi:hypothetical protein
MNHHRRRPIDAVYCGPPTKFELHHAKAIDGIAAGLRAIYEPEDPRLERLKAILQILQRERAAIEQST